MKILPTMRCFLIDDFKKIGFNRKIEFERLRELQKK